MRPRKGAGRIESALLSVELDEFFLGRGVDREPGLLRGIRIDGTSFDARPGQASIRRGGYPAKHTSMSKTFRHPLRTVCFRGKKRGPNEDGSAGRRFIALEQSEPMSSDPNDPSRQASHSHLGEGSTTLPSPASSRPGLLRSAVLRCCNFFGENRDVQARTQMHRSQPCNRLRLRFSGRASSPPSNSGITDQGQLSLRHDRDQTKNPNLVPPLVRGTQRCNFLRIAIMWRKPQASLMCSKCGN